MHIDRASRDRLPALLFVAVAFFHIALAWVCGPAGNWHGQTSEYYQLLTDAFLAGQTSLLVQPPAQLLALPDPYDPAANAFLRLHDASLYHGKYYLYFGPTPALVLFLPYKVLTGSHLPSRIAVGLFCAGGFACSCALFFLLAKREKWDCPRWFASAAVLSLGTAPGIVFLLYAPSFYEVAISAGYCFVMAGFLFIASSLEQDSPRTASLLAAGLCFGLAVGCRPNFALPAILMVLLVAWRIRSHKTRALAFVSSGGPMWRAPGRVQLCHGFRIPSNLASITCWPTEWKTKVASSASRRSFPRFTICSSRRHGSACTIHLSPQPTAFPLLPASPKGFPSARP